MKLIFKPLLALFLYFSGLLYCSGSYACDPVTGLHATAVTHTSATLNWNATVCDSFLVRYYITGTADIHFLIVQPGTAVSVTINSLYPSTHYSWLIHTYCNGGQSGAYQSSPATFTTTSGMAPCLAPNLLLSRAVTNTTANVAWNYQVDADSFLVRYHVEGSTNYFWKFVPGLYHSVTLHDLSPSSIYQWDVRSICNGVRISGNYTNTFVTNCDTIPVPEHIVICIMENKGFQQIIDSFNIAPFINALAYDPMSALFTQSYGIEHPSQPNYLDLFSGSNQGMNNNNVPPAHFTTPNLARELLDAGKTFIGYSENLPYTGCDTIRSGNYERKHNPVANWMGNGVNQVPDTCNQPFSNFPNDFTLLPTVCYVVPDQANDMHNGTITTGDSWIAAHLDGYIQWARTNNSLFILTFDEDNSAYNNRIVTIFTGPMVRGGTYSKYMNHFSLLRTLEDIYATDHAGHATNVESVRECWLSDHTGIESPDKTQLEWAVYGFAGNGELNVDYNLPASSIVSIEVYTLEGKLIYTHPDSRQSSGLHRIIINPVNRNLQSAIYIVRLRVNDQFFSRKTVVIE